MWPEESAALTAERDAARDASGGYVGGMVRVAGTWWDEDDVPDYSDLGDLA